MTIEINNPIIDSIEQEITILKKEMIKDQVFYHCKKHSSIIILQINVTSFYL